MKLRACVVLVFIASLVPSVAQQADAAIGCGSTINHSVTLKADIGPCPSGDAITLTGHGFTFNLGGHRIIGGPSTNGISVVAGSSRIVIRNGEVSDCDDGIVVFGRRQALIDMVSHDNALGVVWYAVGGSIKRVRAWQNGTTGLYMSNPSQGTHVTAFTAINNGTGGSISVPVTITKSFFTNSINNGMSASGPDEVFTGNYFNENGGIGLHASGLDPTIGSNIANFNTGVGMSANVSLIDLGGNLARSNASPQCVNVSCN
jgi:hypothetical protein